MIVFNSSMGRDITEMIEFKVATNFKQSAYEEQSKAFDCFCSEFFPDETVITETITLSWIKDAFDNHTKNTAHKRISYLRTLASYQKAMGKHPYIPPKSMLSGGAMFIPYILSDDEMTGLFHQIDTYNKGSKFERILFSTYFRLTYTCGLRPREGRELKRSNVDLNTGEVRIVNTKWHKSRTIVMSDDMLALARNYATLRDMKYPESEYFFPKGNGECYSAGTMQTRFKKSYEKSRPDLPKELLPHLRVYDLRHRFATAALVKWLDQKVDLKSRLIYLQTYMGHKNISSTAYYIHLLPENLKGSGGIDWENMNAIIPEVELWDEK